VPLPQRRGEVATELDAAGTSDPPPTEHDYDRSVVAPRKRSTKPRASANAAEPFRSEGELIPVAREWLLNAVSRGGEHWLVIDEHLVGTRIPDLIAARVDLRALRARIRAEQWEPLKSGELQVLSQLRRDRSTTVLTVSAAVGYTGDAVRRLLRRLEQLGYVTQDGPQRFRRVRPRYKLFNRFIAVEAKLRDWRRALVQARSHRSFAQECYVAFDAAYAARFGAAERHFQGSGIGLLAVHSPDLAIRILRPRASRTFDPNAFALAGEQLWMRLQGVTRPLPQTRLPGAAALIAHPGGLGSPESRSRTLVRLLDDLAGPQQSRSR
jgi:hypothetical protein